MEESGLSWLAARDRLLAELAEDYPPNEADPCPHCDGAVREAVKALKNLPPDTAGEWDVDRDTYLLSRV